MINSEFPGSPNSQFLKTTKEGNVLGSSFAAGCAFAADESEACDCWSDFLSLLQETIKIPVATQMKNRLSLFIEFYW